MTRQKRWVNLDISAMTNERMSDILYASVIDFVMPNVRPNVTLVLDWRTGSSRIPGRITEQMFKYIFQCLERTEDMFSDL